MVFFYFCCMFRWVERNISKDTIKLIRQALMLSALLSLVFYLVFMYINAGQQYRIVFEELLFIKEYPQLVLQIFIFILLMHFILKKMNTSGEDGQEYKIKLSVELPVMIVFISAYAYLQELYFRHVYFSNLRLSELQDLKFRQIAGIDFIIFLFVYTLYRLNEFYKRLKDSAFQQSEMRRAFAQTQLDTLRAQVNPHFLFNNLNVLSSLISVKPDLAERFVERLAKIYRYVLEHKDSDFVSLKTELDFIKSYNFLLETRFGKSYACELNIDEKYLGKKIPTLSLQILIENAVKHNVVSEECPLTVRIKTGENGLEVVNQIKKRLDAIDGTGFGLGSIIKRYELTDGNKPVIIDDGLEFKVILPLIEN